MTAREKRLEAALVRKERELIDAERERAWYFSRWLTATLLVPDLAGRVDGYHREHGGIYERGQETAE